LNYDSFDCFTQRENLNKLFNATNSSMYNIYDKCYKAKPTEFSYVNTGCEDEAGIVNFLNDPSIRNKFNINVEKEWVPCNFTVFEQYHGRNNSFWIYPFLIQNKLKIVQFVLFSGCIQVMLTLSFLLSVLKDGLKNYVTLLRCQ
jgi:hypothetical protein